MSFIRSFFWRRSFFAALATWVLLIFTPSFVWAQSTSGSGILPGGFAYTYADGNATVTGYHGTDVDLTIPDTIPVALHNLPVTAIGDNFFHFHNLTSIFIPNGVTSIGDSAFDDCPSLLNVTMGNSVAQIGNATFSNCTNLVSVLFKGNLPSAGTDAFQGDDNLTAVYYFPGSTGWGTTFEGISAVAIDFDYTVANGNVTITDYVGSGGNITIPSSIGGLPVSSIGEFALDSCQSLTAVTIPDSVTTIGNYAFDNCVNLITANIGSGVASIGPGPGPFADCSNLTAINVDSQNAFYSSVNGVLFDKGQTTLIQYPNGLGGNYAIPEGVTTLGQSAFDGSKVASIVIPESLSTIPRGSFLRCQNLASITVDILSTSYISLNGVLFDKDQTQILRYPPALPGVYSIPEGVSDIQASAFDGSLLTDVIIPDSVVSIESEAFNNCVNLTSVIIPRGVTSIQEEAFRNCVNLTSVYFLGNAPSILSQGTRLPPGSHIFLQDTGLTSIYYLPGTTGWGENFDQLTTVVFVPSSFNAWQNLWFTAAQLGNAAVSGAVATPANDNVPNLVKYAFNINPFAPMGINHNPSLPAPAISNGNLVLTFNAAQTDISYVVEASTDMMNWSQEGVSTSMNGTQETASSPLPDSGSVFLHIVITPVP